jgi:hypothetical protein
MADNDVRNLAKFLDEWMLFPLNETQDPQSRVADGYLMVSLKVRRMKSSASILSPPATQP